MFKSLFLTLAAGFVFAAASPAQTAPKKASALDKPTLQAYLKHLFAADDRVVWEIGDAKPSTELPNFVEVPVKAVMGAQFQTMSFLVSKDGQKIIQGNVFDVASNPFKKDLDRLKTENAPDLGTKGATVVLVEFSDFQCPYCSQEAQMIRQNLLATYPTQVHLYFKPFPLDMHPWAKPAAVDGLCVQKQKPALFWEYHDWIFAHQSEVTPENLKDKVMEWAGGQKDLNAAQFKACVDTQATLPEVQKSIADGMALEITGTPTLFVNGRRLAQAVDWPSLKNIIDNEIEYQKTAKNAGEDCGCSLELNLPGMPQAKPATTLGPPKKN